MPRQNRRRAPGPSGGSGGGPSSERVETAPLLPDGDWLVRPVSGAAATKAYRCPGCDQQVLPGTPHLVTWPADSPDAEDRRHWHGTCWTARSHRRPRVLRSRNAPRY